jgi:hypothetical protein
METAASLHNDHYQQQHHTASAVSSLDFGSKTLLSWIAILDSRYGAQEWNLHLVAVTTAIFLLFIRLVLHKKRGVDWYALIHALVSGWASLAIVYLNFFAAEKMTGVPEPLRSIVCQGPLTSLHRILPAITMGYALFDLLDGFTLGPDFILHGAATFCMMAFFVEQDISEVVAPYLIMEVSTIFLTTVRADFFTPTMTMITQALFVLNFFIFRIILTPIMWLELVWTMHNNTQRRGVTEESCLDSSALPVLIGGLLFHMLNCFWFFKIVKKVRRKLSGKEGIQSNNGLKQDGDHLPALKLADSDLDQDTPEKKKQK